eukprot:869641-Rhodomonas_salina.5
MLLRPRHYRQLRCLGSARRPALPSHHTARPGPTKCIVTVSLSHAGGHRDRYGGTRVPGYPRYVSPRPSFCRPGSEDPEIDTGPGSGWHVTRSCIVTKRLESIVVKGW